MCGIAVVADTRPGRTVTQQTLRSMVRTMAHRGPNDEGFYLDRGVGLAHRRLAVIDPTPAGHQPMVSSDGRLAVSYNGTVYNYHALRSSLQAQGHRFVSQCDTEVLIHGWSQWGSGLVERLNGHFAFAMWDSQAQRLHLVRDRFGTKPLYYAQAGGVWLVASEIKAILAHPAFTPRVNLEALSEYFTFQNLFRYHTMFQDVHLVPPANVITVDLVSGQSSRRSYWDYDFSHPDEGLDEKETQEELQRLLVQAVSRQLLSDVPVGAYLSGGMDSGSIVAIASQELRHMPTFTCGWHLSGVEGNEASFDERQSAEAMSSLFKTEHYEQVVGHSDVAWVLPSLVHHLEDLRLGMSYGHYYIARLASKFVKVCLSGAGGDELFGGYPWRYFRLSHARDKQSFISEYYAYWQRLVRDEWRGEFFQPRVGAQLEGQDMRSVMARVFTFHPDLGFDRLEDHIANSLYFEAKTFLHGLFLIGDRLSMAHGLEERMPFMDNDLVDFAQRIPVRFKLKNLSQWKKQDENVVTKKQHYYAEHDDGKNILRKAMRAFLPAEVLNRVKQGFSSPDENWYRGPNLEFVRQLILDRKAHCHDYINPQTIEWVMGQHCQEGRNHRLLIWSLINFELWLRIFLGGEKTWSGQSLAPASRA